jgi:DNA-binding response OmpR family regulator
MDTLTPSPRPPRVLVIDDDRHVRMLLCDLLAAWGYAADAAADGAEGLSRFGPGTHDVVLTDLGMPGLSGLDVIAGVRDRDPAVGVVMFTAFAGDLDDQRQRLRFTVLRKPLDIEALRRAVGAALETRSTPA